MKKRNLQAPRLALLSLLSLAGCAPMGLRDDLAPVPPGYAKAPATAGILAELANELAATHGAEQSGFYLLNDSVESLNWRLALIDSAVSSIDIQAYLWYPDAVGRLLLERVAQAARRGVQVRLVIDDVLMWGMDQSLADIDADPNIEIRLFNPWSKRRLGGRAMQGLVKLEKFNTRMHNKLLIADGHAVILGGRNNGDYYFGLNPKFNFRDLDILAIGHMTAQSTELFDEFWNSEWVVPVSNLTTSPDPERADAGWRQLQETVQSAEELSAFPRDVRDWTEELDSLPAKWHLGTSEVVYDQPSGSQIEQSMTSSMRFLYERADEELFVTNAYIIPTQIGIEFIEAATSRGVDVRILTNSLASHDVPAVNSHYQRWRGDFVAAGAHLYEMRPDAAVRSIVDVEPAGGNYISLHTKAAVIDRRYVFIGSMNLDPRSADINTEMGAIIDSPTLAAELGDVMVTDMDPMNAWQVELDEDGDVYWSNDEETVYRQPARSFIQRVQNAIFRIVPARHL